MKRNWDAGAYIIAVLVRQCYSRLGSHKKSLHEKNMFQEFKKFKAPVDSRC